ncbi:OmpA family protein [Spiractinospora alimapuensis]|uniref:OmpA family protein n=1 Tax=Spiractinospora alimapuensis TaxID=2820884 RepID=UPI001F206B56|nr:OmpA family protein [Spiractinospora alimapuensis]QVQ54286.1 OmpA family protein [Spiractinospora alimapuensis]
MEWPRPGRGVILLGAIAMTFPLAPAANADSAEDAPPEEVEQSPVPMDAIDESILDLGLEESVSSLLLEESVQPLAAEDVEGDVTTVTVASDVLFDFDEADLTSRAESTIEDIAADLADVTGTVEIVGHTDGVGDADYNQQLSEERADAVADALGERLDGADLDSSGRGMDDPVVAETEDNPDAAAQNRRVEISYGG